MSDRYSNVTDSVELRPVILPEDADFLERVYISTREDLNLLPLDTAQKQAVIKMQYIGQKQQYDAQYPDADHDLILHDGTPVGRLLVDRGPNGIYLVDISLLPNFRGMGVGTKILNDLVEEAENAATVLSLHVMKTNPAARLYLRAGLNVTADDGLYLEMKTLSSRKS